MILPRLPRPSISDYLKGIGKSILTNALICGLSASVPPLGAVAIPAYMAYSYTRLGYDLYKAYDELSLTGNTEADSVGEASESLGEFVTEQPADTIASSIVNKVKESGLLEDMAKKTGVEEVIFAEMLKGSTSSALSSSGGELAKFIIKKVVGA